MRWVKPMDEADAIGGGAAALLLVTLEENAVAGGAGAAVNEFLAAQGHSLTVLNLGIPDIFIEHGTHADQLAWTGLDAESILRSIKARQIVAGKSLVPELKVGSPIEISRLS